MTEIKLTKPDNNPIMISVGRNFLSGRYDLAIQIGNFGSDEEARAIAGTIKRMLETELRMRFKTAGH